MSFEKLTLLTANGTPVRVIVVNATERLAGAMMGRRGRRLKGISVVLVQLRDYNTVSTSVGKEVKLTQYTRI